MRPRYIQAMQGLGDTIYSRPFIKAAVERGENIYLRTSWPQLFQDLDAHMISPGNVGLRTQHKNINLAAEQGLYERFKTEVRWERWQYVTQPDLSISAALSRLIPIHARKSWALDLPDFGPTPVPLIAHPYIIVRPATVRGEWRADNRNPRPEYLVQAGNLMREAGYMLIGVADLEPESEWPIEPMPDVDQAYYRGELALPELMALVQGCAGIISPVGWAVPAALAARKPLFCIGGGQGAHNSPKRLVDPRIDTGMIHWAMPENYCLCKTWTHPCDRTIANIEQHLKDWRHANQL